MYRSGGKSEDALDEADLLSDISLCQQSNLSFADHMHCLIALDRSFCTGERAEAEARIDPAFDRTMILLDNIVEIRDHAAATSFLEQMVGLCKPKQEIHIILDNLSAHKTQKVAVFLQQHPNVKLHFTPTYSSWLNQVEIWFSRIERDVIARGVFSSVSDLARKLIRYIRAYSKNARPFHWKYSDLHHRVAT